MDNVFAVLTGDLIKSRRLSNQQLDEVRQALDQLTQYYQMSIALPQSAGVLVDWLRVVIQLCDSLIGHWTQRQAEIMCIALAPDSPLHAEIAERLDPPDSAAQPMMVCE